MDSMHTSDHSQQKKVITAMEASIKVRHKDDEAIAMLADDTGATRPFRSFDWCNLMHLKTDPSSAPARLADLYGWLYGEYFAINVQAGRSGAYHSVSCLTT